ncbi:cyclase family protein [Conexibacter woesei]|uniref:Cyclase family protein n=1 Tax=Conexibacter woesei (strain DSM 14684 / CCUG 47730 / CIP 108061 / JCM 11494 / NBRC 100937 / ID131577) TaxID=469383 RepID=D3F9U0_CONWI|nr:cyclase family protein [Conexibacter woesei]ADB51152.1 cyclase family protein [Conexibacter woesei DSM 14684]
MSASLAAQLAAATLIDLEQPRRMGDPIAPVHAPGLVYGLHRRHEPGLGRRTSASGLICTPEHAGTHIDALSHQAENLCMHGGVRVDADVQTSTGFTTHGVESLPPLVRPGVLLDLPALRGGPLAPDELIGVDELQAAAAASPAPIAPGSVVLVRTGYGAHWDDPPHYLRAPGIAREGSEWLAQQEVAAVGADNVVWDALDRWDDVTESILPGHVVLLVRAGIPIVENLRLEELARAAPRAFTVVVLPLKYVGGTGSPVRPIAIVPSAEEP